jgi:hypothetical protein
LPVSGTVDVAIFVCIAAAICAQPHIGPYVVQPEFLPIAEPCVGKCIGQIKMRLHCAGCIMLFHEKLAENPPFRSQFTVAPPQAMKKKEIF